MPLNKLSTADLKKLGVYFRISENTGREQLASLIIETLSNQDPVGVYQLIDALPANRLNQYVEVLAQDRNYLGGAGGQARWRGNLIWEPLKKLALFSELTAFDDTALSIFLLLLDENAVLKKSLRIDPVLEHLQGKNIEELASQIFTVEQLESVFSCYDILEKSSYALPSNMKSQNWARLLIKQALELKRTEKEELQLSIISLFQSDDPSYFVQALSLLEALFSLEEIAQFLGFGFSEVFPEGMELNLSIEDDSSLLEWMAWLQGDPRMAAYVLLWFLGIVYEQEPERIRFKGEHFTFSFASNFDSLETCFQQGFFSEAPPPLLWHNFQFTWIPPEFYQLGNIRSVVPSKEMREISASLFCLPNLKALAFGNMIRKINLIDIEQVENSPLELLIIQGALHQTIPIPDFVWRLPMLRRLLVRNISAFQPPQDILRKIPLAELKIFFSQKIFALDLKRLENLRRVEIISEKKRLEWCWSLPKLESLTLSEVGSFTLTEQPFLQEISLRSAEEISIRSLPLLESFTLGFLGGKGAYQLQTDQIFQVLMQSKKLRTLAYGSHATEWPQEALSWESLETLQISRWQGLLSLPENLYLPCLKQLICNPLQVNLGNMPSNIEHLRIINPGKHIRARFSRGLSNFPALKRLELIDVMEEISEGVWEDIVCCTSLRHLRIERSNVRSLPKNIANLRCLETIVLDRTGAQVFQTIFASAPSLKRIEVQELRGREIFVPERSTAERR